MSRTLVVDIEKQFPDLVIQGAWEQAADTFSVTVLFGPSGCGKTTLLRCLAGLERPDHGSIRCGAETWFDAEQAVMRPPQERGIGYLFQDYALFPHLTVEDNIGYGLYEWPRAERRERVQALLERLQLSGLGERYPHQLSGGQQQRVALARALARRPRLLLLDEPLTALDAPTRHTLRRELRDMLVDFGIPTVIVTHDWLEASALGDQVLVLEEGRIRQRGPVHEVFSHPADPTVAHIVGVETVEPGQVVRVEEGLATVAVGPVEIVTPAPSEVERNVYVCIRAEDVALYQQASGATSIRNHLPGHVQAVHVEGSTVRVIVDVGFELTALVTRPAYRELDLQPGDSVTAAIKAQALHLVPRK